MPSVRLKGMDTTLIMTADGQVLSQLTTIKNHEFAAQLEILKEGYLGEPSDRRDDVYRGIRGKFTLHVESRQIFDFWAQAIERAARQTPGTTFNVKVSFQFPDGDRVRVIIPDVFFGEFPMNAPERAGYVETSVDYESGAIPQFI